MAHSIYKKVLRTCSFKKCDNCHKIQPTVKQCITDPNKRNTQNFNVQAIVINSYSLKLTHLVHHICSISWYDVWYNIINRNWVDTQWQQYSTHLHTNNTQNTENRTYITIKKLNIHNNKKLANLGSASRALSLWVIPWYLPYNWGKSTDKPQGSSMYKTSRHSTIQEQWTVKYAEEKQ
jgi:hypothetical protein